MICGFVSLRIVFLYPELKATTPVPKNGSIHLPFTFGAKSMIQGTSLVFMPWLFIGGTFTFISFSICLSQPTPFFKCSKKMSPVLQSALFDLLTTLYLFQKILLEHIAPIAEGVEGVGLLGGVAAVGLDDGAVCLAAHVFHIIDERFGFLCVYLYISA